MKALRPRTRTWEKVQNPDRVSKMVGMMAGIYALCVGGFSTMLYMLVVWAFSLQWSIEGIALTSISGGIIGFTIGLYLTISTIHLALSMSDEDVVAR